MKGLNCPNCGAVIEPFKNKCDYCGTSYFDMSCVDFEEGKPFYLKIKYNGYYITQLVRPNLTSIECKSETVDVIGGPGNVKYYAFETERKLETNVRFDAVTSNNSLCIIEKV